MTAKRPPAFARHDPRQALMRLVIAVVSGTSTALAIPARFGPALRTVAAWDVAAFTLLLLGLSIVLHATAQETGRRAAADDPGRHASNALVIASSAISLLATAAVLRQAHHYSPRVRDVFVGLCVLAVAGSWVLTQTMYTLRYAHLYYHDDHEGIGGLEFPGGGRPSYLDFAYLSFTIGMCFQVSDVTVSSRQIRRTVLGHALLSFVYNTAIVATAINLAVGVFS